MTQSFQVDELAVHPHFEKKKEVRVLESFVSSLCNQKQQQKNKKMTYLSVCVRCERCVRKCNRRTHTQTSTTTFIGWPSTTTATEFKWQQRINQLVTKRYHQHTCFAHRLVLWFNVCVQVRGRLSVMIAVRKFKHNVLKTHNDCHKNRPRKIRKIIYTHKTSKGKHLLWQKHK